MTLINSIKSSIVQCQVRFLIKADKRVAQHYDPLPKAKPNRDELCWSEAGHVRFDQYAEL